MRAVWGMAAAVCSLAACGGSGSSASVASIATAPADNVQATPSTVAVVDDTVGDLTPIVSASGGGAVLGTIQVADVVVDADAGAVSPWIRFDLVVPYQALEANTVAFVATDGWSQTAGDPPQVRVEGPLCAAGIVCDGDARSLPIADGVTSRVGFEVYRGGALAALTEGALTVDVAAVFDFAHPSVPDVPITFTVRIDLVSAAAPPVGDSTPLDTGASGVVVVGGGFDLLVFPVLSLANSEEELAAILRTSRRPVDAGGLGIDWATQVGLVVAIPTDACPPVLAGLDIDGRVARPTFVNPGYGGCDQPLLSSTVIATVGRDLLHDVDRLELPAHSPFFEEAVTAEVALDPAGPSGANPVTAPLVEFGERLGRAALPPLGEASVGALDDGSPVVVVHHHDGTVSALDPRATSTTSPSEATSLRVVRWVASTRHFLGGGVWDEYGRRIDGFRDTDLLGFATRVVDGQVEIGLGVGPPAGAPIALTADPPASADVLVTTADPLTLADAVGLGLGRSAWVDADVVIGPEGALLCDAPMVPGSIAIESCPPGSPSADGIDPGVGYRTVWFGPLLVSRTATGFARIAATGGTAGVALVP